MSGFKFFDFLGRKLSDTEVVSLNQKLTDQVIFKEIALHIGISYIANTLSKCEFKVYKNGKEEKDPLYYRLNISPNPNQSSSQFINQFVEHYYYDGHALLFKHNNFIYCADNFDVDDDNPLKENVFFNLTFRNHQLTQKYRSKDVFYMKLDDKNVKKLIDVLYLQYGEVISQALAVYKRTNGAKYKLLLENYRAGEKSFNELYKNVIQKQLKTFIENDNSVYPQYKGTDLQEFSARIKKDTSDIIAMRKEIFEIVSQALKIPLSMMYGNITSMDEIVKVYLSFCIDPLADMIGEELTRKYFTYEDWLSGSCVKVDTSSIKHIDILEAADKVDKLLGCGVGNIDELRSCIGWEPLGTDFSTSYFMSKNYTLAKNILTEEGGE